MATMSSQNHGDLDGIVLSLKVKHFIKVYEMFNKDKFHQIWHKIDE